MSMDCFVVPPRQSPISSLAAAGIGFDGSPLADLLEHFPWPTCGEKFDVVIIVTGGGKWELERELCEDTIPPKVANVISDTGCGLDDPLFNLTELPMKAGRYAAQLEYWHQDSIDWESGHNDPNYGFNVLSLRRLGIVGFMQRAATAVFDMLVKRPVRWFVRTWPAGYLCDFHWAGQGRIRLTKGFWVIIGGETKNDSTDALPINFVSEQLIKRIAEELNGKWYMPAAAGQK